MSTDDNGHEDHVHEYSLPVPPPAVVAAILGALGADPGKEAMKMRDTRNRVFEFIESLDVDQLRTLRQLLHIDRKGRAYIDGMIAWELRKRNVDPDGELVPDELPSPEAD